MILLKLYYYVLLSYINISNFSRFIVHVQYVIFALYMYLLRETFFIIINDYFIKIKMSKIITSFNVILHKKVNILYF